MPTMHAAEVREHATFQALMWALSYPGQPQRLPTAGLDAFVAVADALVDLETSYFTPHAPLATALARTGGRALGPREAAYQFYPQPSIAALDLLAAAPVGTHRDPDHAATLVLGCTLGSGTSLHLSGPGIATPHSLSIGAIPSDFWALRNAAIAYPLGWDLFMIADDHVIGLPRTTIVEVR